MIKEKEVKTSLSQNMGIISNKDMDIITSLKVLVVGLGGLGGNIINGLVRLGVTSFYLVDYDVFDISNLNRQLFSNYENIELFKCDVLKSEITKINPEISIELHKGKIQEIAIEKLHDIDYIIDAVDNLESKKYIAKIGKELNTYVLHGACAGWYGQVAWITPGNTLIEDVYLDAKHGLEKELLNPPFAPSVTAGYMLSEFLKMIQKSDQIVMDELLLIDLFNNVTMKTGKRKD